MLNRYLLNFAYNLALKKGLKQIKRVFCIKKDCAKILKYYFKKL